MFEKWWKSNIKYSLGFSRIGFLIVLFPMVPNFFYFLLPNEISQRNLEVKSLLLDVLEHGSQVVFIAVLIFMKVRKEISMHSHLFIGMTIFLLSYYILWILLFAGLSNPLIIICMAVFPVIYFLLAEIWLRNFFAIVPTVIFGIVHVIITYREFILIA